MTFEDRGGKTLLTFHELYPSKEALQGWAAAVAEQLDHLDELLSGIGENRTSSGGELNVPFIEGW